MLKKTNRSLMGESLVNACRAGSPCMDSARDVATVVLDHIWEGESYLE